MKKIDPTFEMIEIKVSFKKSFAPDGTVHKKRFTVPRKVYDVFLLALQAEQVMEKEHYRKMSLNAAFEKEENFVYMNLTQSAYFVDWALRQHELKMNKERAILNENAYLVIVE